MAEEDESSGIMSWHMWLLQFFILLGLLVLFIWLGIRPKGPNSTVTDFSVQNGSISFSIEVENPNKESQIYYANINFTCYNNQQTLGSASFPSFSQDNEEKTPLSETIVLVDKVWKDLEAEIAAKKARVQVTLATKIRYRTWGIKSPRKKLHQKGQLSIGPDGKVPGKAKLSGSKKWRIKTT